MKKRENNHGFHDWKLSWQWIPKVFFIFLYCIVLPADAFAQIPKEKTAEIYVGGKKYSSIKEYKKATQKRPISPQLNTVEGIVQSLMESLTSPVSGMIRKEDLEKILRDSKLLTDSGNLKNANIEEFKEIIKTLLKSDSPPLIPSPPSSQEPTPSTPNFSYNLNSKDLSKFPVSSDTDP